MWPPASIAVSLYPSGYKLTAKPQFEAQQNHSISIQGSGSVSGRFIGMIRPLVDPNFLFPLDFSIQIREPPNFLFLGIHIVVKVIRAVDSFDDGHDSFPLFEKKGTVKSPLC